MVLCMPRPQISEPRTQSAAMHNRHLLQRIIEVPAAITTNFIGSSLEGENPAHVPMMTTQGKIQHGRQRMHKPIPSREFLARTHLNSPASWNYISIFSARNAESNVCDLIVVGDDSHNGSQYENYSRPRIDFSSYSFLIFDLESTEKALDQFSAYVRIDSA